MKELYTDTVSAVRIDGHLSEWFTTGSGVRQVCTIAPNIFLPPMDRILNRTVETAQIGTTLGTEIFTDFDFADDVAYTLRNVSGAHHGHGNHARRGLTFWHGDQLVKDEDPGCWCSRLPNLCASSRS